MCACAAVVAYGLVAPSAPAAQAATSATFPTGPGLIRSGIAGKCLDVYGGSSADGTPVDLWDCATTGATNWQIMPDGTVQIAGKCLDIIGNGTANGTKVDLWTCNGGANQQWEWNGDAFSNRASGRCLDDPSFSTANGTQVQIWDCNFGSNQGWSSPGGPAPEAPVGGVTNPGGDFVANINDGGVDPAIAGQVLSTYWPESVGLPAGSSLNDLMSATYNSMAGTPDIVAPPNVPGAWASVNGSIITIDIPAGDVQALENLPSWGSAIVAGAAATLAAIASYVVCIGAFAAAAPVAAAATPFVIRLCSGVSTFFWTLTGGVVNNWLQGIPFDAIHWAAILSAAIAFGLGGYGYAWLSPWLSEGFPILVGQIAASIRTALQGLSPWVAAAATMAAATANWIYGLVAGIGGVALQAAEQNGMASPVSGAGPIYSGVAGKCLDNYGGSGANGTVVDIWDCSGTAARWTRWSNGNITIGGKCLDAAGAGTGNYTHIQLWDCNGGDNQVWQFVYPTLQNPVSGRCLDVPGGTSVNGTQLELWDCNNGPGQQWVLP